MELKPCENCKRVFFGERSQELCPLCTVTRKSNQTIQRAEAAHELPSASFSAAVVER
jgi:hypothetical protein